MKIFRYLINILFAGLILYVVTAIFAIYDTDCENLKDDIGRIFKDLEQWFMVGLMISIPLNAINEWKIEKQNFGKRILKLSLIHICIFIVNFLIGAAMEFKGCGKF